jgi:hypothetical protein
VNCLAAGIPLQPFALMWFGTERCSRFELRMFSLQLVMFDCSISM